MAAIAALAAACSSPTRLSRDEMLDPETCRDCHPRHVEEWESSMHAYAADDPVFLAMNELGQEQTGGELGSFCVQCHAPMALRDGLTTDGLNLRELPQQYKGVTCFFCHTVEEVDGDHNNPLILADDLTMRGELDDPIESGAHASAYSPLHDRTRVAESSRMCGACHDIVTPAGVHVERTYLEWQGSVFNRSFESGGLSCGGCHMEGTRDLVADVEGVPLRESPNKRRKEHAFPGIDIALTPWPGKGDQIAKINRDLNAAISPRLCFNPSGGGRIEYTLDNVFAGHMVPSGAAQDRRMWAEITATQGDTVILATGQVAEGQAVVEVAATDPDLWQLRDFTFDGDGNEAHFFWQVRSVESELLPPAVTNDPSDPRFIHSLTRTFELGGAGAPDRIEAQVKIRPVGLELLDELIAEDKLDAAVRAAMPTFEIAGTHLVWTAEAAGDDLCVDPGSSAE